MHKCHICNKNISPETNIPEQRGCHEHSDSGQLNIDSKGVPVADETPESDRLLRVLLHEALERTSKVAIVLFETNVSVLWGDNNFKEHWEDSNYTPSCWSLLALATWVGDVGHVRLLLTEPNACNVDNIVTKPDNLTALDILARRSTNFTQAHEEIRSILMGHGSPRIPRGVRGRDRKSETNEDKVALHLAAENDDIDSLKFHMSFNKEWYKLKTELEGDTVFMVAVKANSLQCARILMDAFKRRHHHAYLVNVRNMEKMTALGIVFHLSYQSPEDMEARTEMRNMLLAHFVDYVYPKAMFDYTAWRSQCRGHDISSLNMTIVCILQYLTESISSDLRLKQQLQANKPWLFLMKRFHHFSPDTQPVEMLCRLSYILVLMMQASEQALEHFLKKPVRMLRKLEAKPNVEDSKMKYFVVATMLPLIYAVEHSQSFCDLYFNTSETRATQKLNTLLKYKQQCLTSLLPRKLEQVENLIRAHLQTIMRKKPNMSVISCNENGETFDKMIEGDVPVQMIALGHSDLVSRNECPIALPEGGSGRVASGPMPAETAKEAIQGQRTKKVSAYNITNRGRSRTRKTSVVSYAEVAEDGRAVPEVLTHKEAPTDGPHEQREVTTALPKFAGTFSDVTMPQQIMEAQRSADVEVVERLLSALTISGNQYDQPKRIWKQPKGVAQKCVARKPVSFKITKHSVTKKSSMRSPKTLVTEGGTASARNSTKADGNVAVKHRKATEANGRQSKKVASPKPSNKATSMDLKNMPKCSDENSTNIFQLHKNIKRREHSPNKTTNSRHVGSSKAKEEMKLRGGMFETAKSMWNRMQAYWSPAEQKSGIGGDYACQHNKSSVRKNLAAEFEDAKSRGVESEVTSEGVHFYWENLAVKYAAENIDAEEEYIADILETLTEVEVEAIAIAHEMDPEFSKDELVALAIAYKLAVRSARSERGSSNSSNDAATLLTMDELAALPLPDDDEASLTNKPEKATGPQDIMATLPTMDEVKAIPLPADMDTEEMVDKKDATPQMTEEDIKAIPLPVETVSLVTMDEAKAIPLPADTDTEEEEEEPNQLTCEKIKSIPLLEEMMVLPTMDVVRAFPKPGIEGIPDETEATLLSDKVEDEEAIPFLPDTLASVLRMDEIRAIPLPDDVDTVITKAENESPELEATDTEVTMDEFEVIALLADEVVEDGIKTTPSPDDTGKDVINDDIANNEVTRDETEAASLLGVRETVRTKIEVNEEAAPGDRTKAIGEEAVEAARSPRSDVSPILEQIAEVESCFTKLPHTAGLSTNKEQDVPPGNRDAGPKVQEKIGKGDRPSSDSSGLVSQDALSVRPTDEQVAVKDLDMTPSRTQSDTVFAENTEEKTKWKHFNRTPWRGSSGTVQRSDKGGMGDAQRWKMPHADKDAATKKTFFAGLDLETWPGHAFMAEDSLTYLARMQGRVACSGGASFREKVSQAVEMEKRGRTEQTRFCLGTDFRKIENNFQRQTICPEFGNPSACSDDCCCSEYKYLLATLGRRYGSYKERENISSGCTPGRAFGSGDPARYWVEEGMVKCPQRYEQGDRMVDRSTQTSFDLINDLTEILGKDTESFDKASDFMESELPEWVLDTEQGPIETSSAIEQDDECHSGVFKLSKAGSPTYYYNETNSHMSEQIESMKKKFPPSCSTGSARKYEVTIPECKPEESANQDFHSQKRFSETIRMAFESEQSQCHTHDEIVLEKETDESSINPFLDTTSDFEEQPTKHANENPLQEILSSDKSQEQQATAESQSDQQPLSPIESFQVCNRDWLLHGNRWRSKLEVLQRLPVECRTVLGNRGGPFICPNIDFFVIGIGKRGGVTVLGSRHTTPLAVTIIHPLRYNTEATQWTARQALAITHENLVKFMGIYFSHQAVFITHELCQGTLDQYIALTNAKGGLQLERKLQMARDILTGLDYLHDRDILHKNLRPTKTFLASDGTVKLGHFGFDSISRIRRMELGILDTCCWQPVELLLFPSLARYSKSSDVQVCGVLLYYLFTGGLHPFGRVVFDIITNIMLGNASPLTFTETNMTLIIGEMLARIPQGRPTVKHALSIAVRNCNCRKAPLQ